MIKGPGTDVPTCACGEYLDLEIVNGQLMCEDCRDNLVNPDDDDS